MHAWHGFHPQISLGKLSYYLSVSCPESPETHNSAIRVPPSVWKLMTLLPINDWTEPFLWTMVPWEGLIMVHHHSVISFMAGMPAVLRSDEEVIACSA